MSSEALARANFTAIRYAQCWEDADILLQGLDVQPGQVCVSIASAGDNTLALLTRAPARVHALDLNPAQLACLELRVAAYRALEHPELLELIGSVPSARRLALYQRCRPLLGPATRAFWDARLREVAHGIGHAGKFERYFALFRRFVLPLVHGRHTVTRLLAKRASERRERFFQRRWNTWRWRWLFRGYFSRLVLGRLGRDPSFFRHVQGSVANRILERTRHALTVLDPADNPYLQWILTGRHQTLPLALRPEHFATIRDRVDRLDWRVAPLENFLTQLGPRAVDAFNLSDIFEYMSPDNYHQLLEKILHAGRPGGRLAYWNMLAPRSRPEHLGDRLRPLSELAERLHRADKAFFYSRFVVEEIAA